MRGCGFERAIVCGEEREKKYTHTAQTASRKSSNARSFSAFWHIAAGEMAERCRF